MKFNAKKDSVKTNIKPVKTIEAKIGNVAKMLKMFSKDLYKNPIQTAIQEYINNAKDAHIMLGKDSSTIEITAPTLANQSVIIKDSGPGLSPDDVVNIFANIAVSNKDNSDLFNGGYGIGSKSWFSVNSSFIVISTFELFKTYYSVHFDESSGIKITVDHEEETKDKNGVEVHLPLANKSQIEEAHNGIIRAVQFWKNPPVLKNLENYSPQDFIYNEKEYSLLDCESNNVVVTLGETQYSIKELPCYSEIMSSNFDLSLAIHFSVGEMELEGTQEVGPDRESFSVACNSLILKKFKKSISKIQSDLISGLPSMNNREAVISIINKKFYTKQFYQHGLKESKESIFFNSMNLNSLIINRKVDYANINSASTTRVNHRVSGIQLIIVNDSDAKQQTLKKIIQENTDSAKYFRKKTDYNSGVYIFQENEYSKSQLDEFKNYFNVVYSSSFQELTVSKERKKKTFKFLGKLIGNNKKFYSRDLDLKHLNDFTFIKNSEFLKTNHSNYDIKNAIDNLKESKPLVILGEKNMKFIEIEGLDIYSCEQLSKVVDDHLKKESKNKLKELIKKGTDKHYIYNFENLTDEDYLVLQNIKSSQNKKTKSLLDGINFELDYFDMKDLLNDYKDGFELKDIEVDNKIINFTKKLRNNHSLLFSILSDITYSEKKQLNELNVLINSIDF